MDATGAQQGRPDPSRVEHFVSLILPAFNEGSHLAQNLRRLLEYLSPRCPRFEVVVVDDGSRDDTAAVAMAEAARDPRIRVLRHEGNRGKGAALATGCLAARGDLFVLIDADLEIPPEEILPLLARMDRTKADVAVGSKYHPEARLRWPFRRRVLSRLYHLVTSVLFRLPLRDTQTGLKAIRREVALDVVPRIRSRRFAWDVEFILLAHKSGHRFVAGPVTLEPSSRTSRVTLRNAFLSGIDTLRIFLRDRWFGTYGKPGRVTRPVPLLRVLVSGDDLGMSPSVNEGLLRGLEHGGLTAAGVLAESAHATPGVAAVVGQVPKADLGLHCDLLKHRSLAGFTWRALAGIEDSWALRQEVERQVESLASLGVRATHVDAHRHFWLAPRARRAVAAACADLGIRAIRAVRPLGPLFASGPIEGLKRLILLGASFSSAGAARERGVRSPDGHVDAQEAARWVARGRLPLYVRGRTVEVIAHPVSGPSDLPASETRTLDRTAETRAVLEPPLAASLARLGARVIRFDEV